jgi:hypothetical protein
MHKKWVLLAAIGCALVTLTLIVTALVLFDKPHFGFLVGTWFLWVVSGGVFVGGLLVLIAAFMAPNRWSWRPVTLMIWALIALTSPAFGFLFLGPWSVLALMLPLVIVILVHGSRG